MTNNDNKSKEEFVGHVIDDKSKITRLCYYNWFFFRHKLCQIYNNESNELR